MNLRIYQLTNTEREVHMMGDYVGVCWNIGQKEKVLKDEAGIVYRAKVWVRSEDEPYIDFVSAEEDATTGQWEADYSPVDGGFGVDHAEQIAKELLEAVEYLKRLGVAP